MKAKIVSTVKIQQAWLDEIKKHIKDIEFEVSYTDELLQMWYNARQKSMYGVFSHLRQIVNAPTGYRYRVYVMSEQERRDAGITDHYAAYDARDRDGVLDFYLSVGDKLQDKTKANGFTHNFPRRFVHECLHGKEQEIGREYLATTNPDRTHEWEADGRLLALLTEHQTLQTLKTKVSLWQRILELTKTLNTLKYDK